MRDTRMECPICRKRFKDRIGHHLHTVHKIPYPDAEMIKNGIIHLFYFPNDLESETETLKLLEKYHYKFEKLRRH